MRKIKFRAWFDGHMYEVANLDWWGDPDQASCDLARAGENGEWEKLFYIYVGEVELMQYTGLKDKNGKEIYEGDIVETIQPTGCKTFMPDGQIKLNSWVNKSSSVVEWQDDNTPGWKGCLRYGSGTLEIIGNIYENPELVEELLDWGER